MNQPSVIVPLHLQRLGKTAREFHAILAGMQLPAPTTSIKVSQQFIARRLRRLANLVKGLTRWVNATRWPSLIGSERVADALMHLVLWRLCRILLVMQSEHALLRSIRDTKNRQRMAACLAECYEHVFTEVAAMFNEVTLNLADPEAALQRQSPSTDENAPTLTTQLILSAPDLGELVNLVRNEWGICSSPQQAFTPAMMRPKRDISFGEALLLIWLAGTIFDRHAGD